MLRLLGAAVPVRPISPIGLFRLLGVALLVPALIATAAAAETTLRLQDLLDEALLNSPEIQMLASGATAAGHRIPQATSLTDPMVMVGYQNDGFNSFSYPEMPDSQFMLSVSQMLPFPGKLALKGEMAEREAEGLQANVAVSRLRTALRSKSCIMICSFRTLISTSSMTKPHFSHGLRTPPPSGTVPAWEYCRKW